MLKDTTFLVVRACLVVHHLVNFPYRNQLDLIRWLIQYKMCRSILLNVMDNNFCK